MYKFHSGIQAGMLCLDHPKVDISAWWSVKLYPQGWLVALIPTVLKGKFRTYSGTWIWANTSSRLVDRPLGHDWTDLWPGHAVDRDTYPFFGVWCRPYPIFLQNEGVMGWFLLCSLKNTDIYNASSGCTKVGVKPRALEQNNIFHLGKGCRKSLVSTDFCDIRPTRSCDLPDLPKKTYLHLLRTDTYLQRTVSIAF
jgi:hypothetical protein